MRNDYILYEKPLFPDLNFPVRISRVLSAAPGPVFQGHWHEEFEFLFFVKGEALVGCGSKQYQVGAGDLIIVNSNELHYAQNLGAELAYYCVIVDPLILQSSMADICEVKYLAPIKQNRILFSNKITEDAHITECINNLIDENDTRNIGYELSVKSLIYKLLVLLLRHHVSTVLNPREYTLRTKRMQLLNTVLTYIENNYMNTILAKDLARLVNISEYYFCHLFKEATGKPLSEYVNFVRVAKAEFLLRTTDMSVTEVALSTGFNNPNYFSRIYRKIKKEPPSAARK